MRSALLPQAGLARAATFVSVLSCCVIALVLSGAATGAAASRSKIAIHEDGTNAQNSPANTGVRGVFTIELAGRPYGPAGTTLIYPSPGGTRYVNGEAQIPFSGTNHLTSKKGTLELAFTGIHIDVNMKVTPSGDVVGSGAEYGTWKISAATGIYKGWKGGGNFAAVLYGYQNLQPHAVEWDGYVTGS